MEIASITGITTLDYPGELAVTIFTQGCNMSCDYCHNKHLVEVKKGTISWQYCIDYIRARINMIDAVVFSGGEPTIHRDLPKKIQEIKNLGLKVGLHTNGKGVVFPEVDYLLLSDPKRLNRFKARKVHISTIIKQNGEYHNKLTEGIFQ